MDKKTIYSNIAFKLRTLRNERGLTQKQVAEKVLGDSKKDQTIAYWESGIDKRQIKIDDLINIADFYGVSLAELTGHIDAKSKVKDYISIQNQLGLSIIASKKLESINKNDPVRTALFSRFIEYGFLEDAFTLFMKGAIYHLSDNGENKDDPYNLHNNDRVELYRNCASEWCFEQSCDCIKDIMRHIASKCIETSAPKKRKTKANK